MLAIETGGHKMSERSRLMILATALKSINPAFEAQFNALADDTATEAVLKALDHVEASHHASPSSDTILYAGQGQHHGRPAFQHRQAPYGAHAQTPPNSLPPRHPTGPRLPRQQRRDNWGSDRGRWCSLHNSSGHSLEECREAAARGLAGATPRATPQTAHTAALAAMTAAAVAAASSFLLHTPQSSILAAMTAATAAAHPSDFAIVSESAAGAALSSEPTPNKPFQNYSVFSLVAPIHLPTIADTSATQHTTNQRDLLHNFIPLALPSRLVCADGGHIECLGHGTLRSTTIVDGQASNIMMCDVAYIPGASHTLISPQQLLDAGCRVAFDQQCGFLFYLDDKLHLFSYWSGNLYYFNITFTPADIATPHAALVAATSPLCLDLIHHRLGHVSERRCHEFVRQSADLSEREKRAALSSSLSPICDVCLAGKQTVRGVSRVPCTNHSVRGAYPGDLLSLDLIGPMRHQSAGGHAYLLTVTDSYSHMHFVRPLPNKTSTAIHAALQAIAASFPPAVRIHQVHLDNARELNALMGAWILDIGAKREPTPPYTSEYNSVVEQFNREVMTRVQCLLFNARLPSEWWAEAARYACNVINLTPTQANLDSRMRLHAHERHKISKQSVPVRFMSVVDYSLSTYWVYIVSQRRIVDTDRVDP
ncbi:integrase core domain containing protein [Acanthamoeba castellanii str. Neff]|uniref:Integrase core domain containing protein n=1 Tax=Acanthamoeba castellanii (strain ATCC 30010 / Neff) TaxID=1257118 RepID=L8HG77_ACACF|nr:integrase core domain containing protein [Acanthamoeba castellanii str. Neff]ELR24539.1 integrase core domain containing protein [Acanthamoeba castellanii str. Neff]